jgi:hypothetical protein
MNILQKIRNQQASSVKKYLKYAIGELLLLVFGILIALQVNNWNVERQNNAMYKVYLESILEDFTKQLSFIGSLELLYIPV